MASIEKRAAGYRVTWREGGRGAPQLHSGYHETKRKAEQEALRIEARLAARKPLQPGRALDLATILARWTASRLAQGRDPHSVAKAARRVELAAEGRWTALHDITPAAIDAWRTAAKRTAGAARVLHAVLTYAQDYCDQDIERRVLVALRPGQRKRKAPQPLLSAAQVEAAMVEARKQGPSAAALLHCLSTYGWRPITAARLTVASLDAAGGTICTANKGGHTNRHHLLAQTLAMLAPLVAGRDDAAPMFIDERQDPPRAWKLYSAGSIPDWCEHVAGVMSYDVKRFAITHLLEVMSAKEAQAITGHLTLSQLLVYPRRSEESGKAAVEKLARSLGTPGSTGRILATPDATATA